MPDSFTDRLRDIAGPEGCTRILRSIITPRPLSIRIQGDDGVRREVISELETGGFRPEAVSWCPEAFRLHGGDRSSVQETESYRSGHLWIQSLSSMAAVSALSITPGDDVLDLCAAPGSKTSMIAHMQAGEGILVANDRSRQRLFKLRANLRQLGVSGVEITCLSGATYGSSHAECFDRVLVDAPCSGEGMLHATDVKGLAEWSEGRIRRLARQQAGLLASGLKALRPGGCCVYSTCTYAPEENEVLVDRVLAKLGDRFSIDPLPAELPRGDQGIVRWKDRDLHPSLSRALRLLPEDGQGLRGFFMIRIRRIA